MAADTRNDVSNMAVSGKDVGVARMCVQFCRRFVKRNLRQPAAVNVRHECFPVTQMPFTRSTSRSKPREIVKHLVVRLEVDAVLVVDDGTVRQRAIPAAGVPGPGNLLAGQRIADGGHGLWRKAAN